MAHRHIVVGLVLLMTVGVLAGMLVRSASAGSMVRTIAVGRNPVAVAVDERTGHVFVAKNDLGLQDQLSLALNCCPRGQGSVTVLDARRGAIQRTVRVGLSPLAIAVDERVGRAFVVSYGSDTRTGRLSVLDTRTGTVVRTVTVGLLPQGVAVDERTGRVFVAGEDSSGLGDVSVLDVMSGRLVRSVTVGMLPTAVAVDARSGRVFVANKGPVDGNLVPLSNGTVTVLDARSGAVLRTIGVGTYPTALAVDERAGRAFVVNASGTTVRTSQGWCERAVQWLQPARLPWLPRPATPPLIRSVTGSVSMLDASR